MTSSYSHCSDCGSWVMDREFVGRGSPCWFRRARRVGFTELVLPCWIVGRGSRIHGSQIHELCFVVLGCGWLFRMAWYGAGLRLLGSAMKRQGWETETRDERDMVLGCGCWVQRWRDRDERWETEESELEMRDRDNRWETEERESEMRDRTEERELD